MQPRFGPTIVLDVPNLTGCSDPIRMEYFRRTGIVHETLRLTGGFEPIIRASEPILNSHDAVLLKATEHDIAPATLYRWLALYKQHGPTGLIPRSGRGHRGRSKVDSQIKVFIREQYLSPQRLMINTVYRQAVAFAQSRSLPIPSHRQVERYLNALPIAVVVYSRSGLEAWQERAEKDLETIEETGWK